MELPKLNLTACCFLLLSNVSTGAGGLRPLSCDSAAQTLLKDARGFSPFTRVTPQTIVGRHLLSSIAAEMTDWTIESRLVKELRSNLKTKYCSVQFYYSPDPKQLSTALDKIKNVPSGPQHAVLQNTAEAEDLIRMIADGIEVEFYYEVYEDTNGKPQIKITHSE